MEGDIAARWNLARLLFATLSQHYFEYSSGALIGRMSRLGPESLQIQAMAVNTGAKRESPLLVDQ